MDNLSPEMRIGLTCLVSLIFGIVLAWAYCSNVHSATNNKDKKDSLKRGDQNDEIPGK